MVSALPLGKEQDNAPAMCLPCTDLSTLLFWHLITAVDRFRDSLPVLAQGCSDEVAVPELAGPGRGWKAALDHILTGDWNSSSFCNGVSQSFCSDFPNSIASRRETGQCCKETPT